MEQSLFYVDNKMLNDPNVHVYTRHISQQTDCVFSEWKPFVLERDVVAAPEITLTMIENISKHVFEIVSQHFSHGTGVISHLFYRIDSLRALCYLNPNMIFLFAVWWAMEGKDVVICTPYTSDNEGNSRNVQGILASLGQNFIVNGIKKIEVPLFGDKKGVVRFMNWNDTGFRSLSADIYIAQDLEKMCNYEDTIKKMSPMSRFLLVETLRTL